MNRTLVHILLGTLIAMPVRAQEAHENPKGDSEVVSLLQNLIQIDSTNPPGNETAVANYLHEYLAGRGIESKVIESAPGRGNIIARIKGTGTKPPLILLGHLDVVPARPEEWDIPPFAGRVEDGVVWGRGAIDMKGMVAMEIIAFLKAAGEKLEGDLVFVGVADEEAGGEYGAKFLIDKFWEEVKGGIVLNEGSIGLDQDGATLYPIQVAEKGVLWLKLTAHGTSGHGSMPYADNPVLHLTQALHRITHYQAPVTTTPVTREFLKRRSAKLPWPQRVVSRLLAIPGLDRIIGPLFRGEIAKHSRLYAMLTDTIAPTMLQAGYKVNVIPDEATATIDARLLPGQSREAFLKRLRKLAGPHVTIEVLSASEPTATDRNDPFYTMIEQVLRDANHEAVIAPYLSPGATDSRFFREKGVPCFGLIPVVVTPDELSGLHGKNERVKITQLELGTDILSDIIHRYLATP